MLSMSYEFSRFLLKINNTKLNELLTKLLLRTIFKKCTIIIFALQLAMDNKMAVDGKIHSSLLLTEWLSDDPN